MGLVFTLDAIHHYLFVNFAVPLIISTLGFIFFGINICQFLYYFQNVAKRDHFFTRASVCTVGVFTLTSTLYQVYYNWLQSILQFQSGGTDEPSIAYGNTVALYSVVIMIVQLFWLSCIQKLLVNNPRLSRFVIFLIGLASFAAFVLSIVVAVLSRLQVEPNGAWPSPEVSIILRVMLGTDLGIDLSILIIIVSQLTALKRRSRHLKTTITKLSWILCLLTFASALTIIGELSINIPQLGNYDSTIPFAISFAPIIPTVYAGSLLAVLNARETLWNKKRKTQPQSEDSGSRRLIPGLKFTVDLSDKRRRASAQNSGISGPTMTFISTRRRIVEEAAEIGNGNPVESNQA